MVSVLSKLLLIPERPAGFKVLLEALTNGPQLMAPALCSGRLNCHHTVYLPSHQTVRTIRDNAVSISSSQLQSPAWCQEGRVICSAVCTEPCHLPGPCLGALSERRVNQMEIPAQKVHETNKPTN